MMFIIDGCSEEDVHLELPEECGVPEGFCGKLSFWLYGVRPADAAWEKMYSNVVEQAGFARGISCGVLIIILGKTSPR